MDFMKKLWPTPFKIQKGNVVSFVVQLLVFLILTALFGWLIGLLSALPVVGIVFGIVGSLMGIYTLIGAVLCLLKFLDLVK